MKYCKTCWTLGALWFQLLLFTVSSIFDADHNCFKLIRPEGLHISPSAIQISAEQFLQTSCRNAMKMVTSTGKIEKLFPHASAEAALRTWKPLSRISDFQKVCICILKTYYHRVSSYYYEIHDFLIIMNKYTE